MKVHADCIPCIMKRVLFQARLLQNGKEFSAVEAGLKTYCKELSVNSNSAELATKVHLKAYEAMGVKDPYLDLKLRADEVAEKFMTKAENFIKASEDPFKSAIRISIVGNIMDFGSGIAIEDPNDFGEIFDELLEEGIESDDSVILKNLVSKSSRIVYLFDNCGESQFDKFLLREIKKMGKSIIGVVRGEPILNDVTLDDALRIGLDQEVDILLDTGGFCIGINLKMISKELYEYIFDPSTVIIAKGMANFESLSDEKLDTPLAYLLRAKCLPVAKSLNVPLNANVVRIH